MVNAKPRLSPWSRLQLVQRVLAGRPAAHVAAEMGVSRATAYKWLARYRAEGSAGLLDRSSRPRSCPTRTDPVSEAAIVALRRDRRLGPARIAGILGLHSSTVHRVLVRHAMPRLSWLDRPSGQVVRRYERSTWSMLSPASRRSRSRPGISSSVWLVRSQPLLPTWSRKSRRPACSGVNPSHATFGGRRTMPPSLTAPNRGAARATPPVEGRPGALLLLGGQALMDRMALARQRSWLSFCSLAVRALCSISISSSTSACSSQSSARS